MKGKAEKKKKKRKEEKGWGGWGGWEAAPSLQGPGPLPAQRRGIQLNRTTALGRTSPPHAGITQRTPLGSAPATRHGAQGRARRGKHSLGGQPRSISRCLLPK